MNKRTTKKDFAAKLAEACDMKKTEAENVVNAFLDTLTNELKDGNKVQFIGFGSFESKTRAAREGRNPSTGATMTIPAHNTVKFSVGSDLKGAING
jgi:DNA-binding protein HU-beta